MFDRSELLPWRMAEGRNPEHAWTVDSDQCGPRGNNAAIDQVFPEAEGKMFESTLSIATTSAVALSQVRALGNSPRTSDN